MRMSVISTEKNLRLACGTTNHHIDGQNHLKMRDQKRSYGTRNVRKSMTTGLIPLATGEI